MTPFPPELIDLILSELHDDPTSLISCALVSRSFCSPAQKVLFSSVHIQADNSALLHDALASKPHLGTKTRVLTVIFDGEDGDQRLVWPLGILRFFPAVTHFDLVGMHCMSWFYFSDEIRCDIADFLHLPSLVDIYISVFFLPFSILADCPQLKSIAIYNIDDAIPKFRHNNDSPIGALKTFIATNVSDDLLSLCSSPSSKLSLVHLRKFSLTDFTPSMSQSLLHLLNLCASSLEELSIHVVLAEMSVLAVLPILEHINLPRLHSFTLVVLAKNRPAKHLHNILRHPFNDTLVLSLSWPSPKYRHLWPTFDAILASDASRRIVVDIGHQGISPDPSIPLDDMRDLWKGLVVRGNCVIVFLGKVLIGEQGQVPMWRHPWRFMAERRKRKGLS